ncbi:hypothetical protein D9M68_666760 [compost metagenome]
MGSIGLEFSPIIIGIYTATGINRFFQPVEAIPYIKTGIAVTKFDVGQYLLFGFPTVAYGINLTNRSGFRRQVPSSKIIMGYAG